MYMSKNKKVDNQSSKLTTKVLETIETDRKEAFKAIKEFSKALDYMDPDANPDAYAKVAITQVKAIESLQKSTDQLLSIFNAYVKNGQIEKDEIDEEFMEHFYKNQTVETD
jgi:hypothetical protein